MAAEVETLHSEQDASALVAVKAAVDNLPEDPHERAQVRLERLRSSFASSLAIVAEMYRDEDWKYLVREDGTEYNSLAEVFSDVMQVSISMARRYVQGATKFYLPLSEVTVEGTRIEITSGTVASLGDEGMADAVADATSRLAGVDDPDEASAIIGDAVNKAREKKTPASSDGDGWDDDFEEGDFEGFDPPGRGYDGPAPAGGGGGGDFSGLPDDDDEDWADGDDEPPTPASGGKVVLEDPVARVLDGADDYSDPAKLGTLEEPLRSVTAALTTLAEISPEEVAKIVTYDTRGVLVPVTKALTNTTRLRALVETQAWYLSRLTQ